MNKYKKVPTDLNIYENSKIKNMSCKYTILMKIKNPLLYTPLYHNIVLLTHDNYIFLCYKRNK
ncbi:hypothetical protein PFBG_01480 [Plasmodium falciparum 7G8]|uniref:Uncharacterized protein n=2 Tax=Plasmodium falciparum TaxID=5833 RepID=W7K9K3_PLAFO|nr:hypothetical protein PFBG_01480 [Plasmodium falciparum 7G8]EWC89650.1 hypothetical protein PFNF54_01561 [Plasmodium falciparum NF54]